MGYIWLCTFYCVNCLEYNSIFQPAEKLPMVNLCEFVFVVDQWYSTNDHAVEDDIEVDYNSETSYEGDGLCNFVLITHNCRDLF